MKKFYVSSFFLVLIDLIIKIIVQNFLNEKTVFIIKNFLYLTFIKNEGAAFSILEGGSIIFILVGIIAIFLIANYIKKHNYNMGYIMLFSGIIGNLIDRVLYGYVIDYIGTIIFDNYMPIFNFADVLIVIGAILVIIGSDKSENRSN